MGRDKKKRNTLLPPATATYSGGATTSYSNPNQEEQSKIDQESSIESKFQASVTEHSGGNPPLQPDTATDLGGATTSDSNPNPEQSKIDRLYSIDLIDAECQAAIASYEEGNHAEALRLMNETCLRYESFGLVHATRSKMHVLEASRIGASDSVLSRQHLRSAVESARRAVSLSPNLVEFRILYAESLYGLSSKSEGFDEVLRVFEQALSVEHPSLQCRDASLSFRFRVFKKQKDSQSYKSESENLKMGKLRTYWNAMSDKRKMGLIELRIGDLREYCRSLCNDGLAERVFLEGVDYAEKNKSWKFWACYYCDENFKNFESRLDHIEREHEEEIRQHLQMKPFLFPEIDADSVRSEVYDYLLANGVFYDTNMVRIVFTGDSSCPLDDRLLRVEVEDGSTSACSICDAEVAVPPDIDAFTKWLFEVPMTSTAGNIAFTKWTLLQDQMKREGTGIPLLFEEEFALIQSLRKKQLELMVQCRSLREIQIICLEELGKREQDGKHVPQSYRRLMKKRLEQVYNAEEGSMFPTRRSQLDAIRGVIREAKNIRELNNSVSEVEDQEDASIRMAVQKKMVQPLSELCRNEAQITMSNSTLWRLLVIYKQSSLDYRGIILDLVPNFIHAKLEALVNEEEKQKPDAAVDSKKNTSRGNTHPNDFSEDDFLTALTSGPTQRLT